MMDTMAEYHGVGLAAPQVHESLRLFVVAFDPTQPDPEDDEPLEPFAIVNPEITPVGEEIVDDWEGCLSIPDIRGRVPRFRESGPGAESARRAHRAAPPGLSRRASSSTRPTTSTASCSSTGCARSAR